MYVELGTDSGATATLKFTFAATTAMRKYEVKVTQYRCDSPVRPPEGCLQYHTGMEGRFTTFNWEGQDGHLQNQEYKICIRQEMGFCCNQYTLCPDTAFEINSLIANDPDPSIVTDVAAVGTACTSDYVLIQGSSSTGATTLPQSRYCGGILSDFTGGLVDVPITGKRIN